MDWVYFCCLPNKSSECKRNLWSINSIMPENREQCLNAVDDPLMEEFQTSPNMCPLPGDCIPVCGTRVRAYLPRFFFLLLTCHLPTFSQKVFLVSDSRWAILAWDFEVLKYFLEDDSAFFCHFIPSASSDADPQLVWGLAYLCSFSSEGANQSHLYSQDCQGPCSM